MSKANVRSNKIVNKVQSYAESGSKTGQKHSFDNTDLRMHEGPTNVSEKLQESRPKDGNQKELLSQANDDKKLLQCELKREYNVIRYIFKKRPDDASISMYFE